MTSAPYSAAASSDWKFYAIIVLSITVPNLIDFCDKSKNCAREREARTNARAPARAFLNSSVRMRDRCLDLLGRQDLDLVEGFAVQLRLSLLATVRAESVVGIDDRSASRAKVRHVRRSSPCQMRASLVSANSEYA